MIAFAQKTGGRARTFRDFYATEIVLDRLALGTRRQILNKFRNLENEDFKSTWAASMVG